MSLFKIFYSPFIILFLVLIIGVVLWKIHIYKVSLGISGILFAGIFIGLSVNMLSAYNGQILSDLKNTMKIFSTLGSSLFVSVIGLQTGLSLNSKSRNSFYAFIIGALMSGIGVVTTLLISTVDQTINNATLMGVLCGALTSTPGLSSICEIIEHDAEKAVLGYSCSYFCGVLLTVIFAMLFTKNNSSENSLNKLAKENMSSFYTELSLISFVVILGNIFEKTLNLFFNISIGSTAFILLFGLIIGYVVKRKNNLSQAKLQGMSLFRNLGLALFFAGTGFTTGMQSIDFEVKALIYGAFITLITIMFGFFLSKMIFSDVSSDIAFIVAGGMTSSPAYGAISNKGTELSSNLFSFAYFGALISLIIALQIIIA